MKEITCWHVVYFSPTHTTKKIVQAIIQDWSGEIQIYDVTLAKDRKILNDIQVHENEGLLVAAPVYAGRLPYYIKGVIESFSGKGNPVIPIVVYGNRAFDDALLELSDLLRNQGFKTIAGGAFIGEHSYSDQVAGGRPDKKDLAIAKAFGKSALGKVKEFIRLSDGNLEQDLINFDLPGKRPYKPLGESKVFQMKTDKTCNDCGTCASYCPSGAIDSKDFSQVDAELCIHCCACIKACPKEAKSFDGPMFTTITKWLEANCHERKEPEIFI